MLTREQKTRPMPRAAILSCLAAIAVSGCSASPVFGVCKKGPCPPGNVAIVKPEQYCKKWIVQDKSKKDVLSKDTLGNMAASNAARVEFGCARNRNEAAG